MERAWSVHGACMERTWTVPTCRAAQHSHGLLHALALPRSHALLPTSTPLSHSQLYCYISTFTSEREAVGGDKR